MGFWDAVDAAAIAGTTQLGVDVTYTPDGGDAVETTAIILYQQRPETTNFSGVSAYDVYLVEAMLLKSVVSDPKYPDTLTFDGATWYILDTLPVNNPAFVKVQIRKNL